MNSLIAALLLCASMLTGFLVFASEDAAAEGPEGWIVGTVTDEFSNPIQAYIVAFMTMGMGGSDVISWTDLAGNYNLTVYGGVDYMIVAGNGSFYMNTTYVSTVEGDEVRADIVLTSISPLVADVTFNGWVRDLLGNPLSSGDVIGYTTNPENMGEGVPLYGNVTSPDLSGWYSVNVIPGTAGGGVSAFGFDGYDGEDNGTEEPLVSGMTYWFNITLGPIIITDDARISGHVYDFSTGLPLENALIQYGSYNEWMESGGYSNVTFSDATGYYEMNVTNGSAQIRIMKDGYSIYAPDNIEILPGSDRVFDAWLVPLTATVRGNVTDGSSGLGIDMARVFSNDFLGNLSMAITNSTGAYTLETFDGVGIAVGAEADSYSREYMMVNISAGETLWMDFVIWPVDAWMNGTVVDKISGAPIVDAGLSMRSDNYEEWEKSDALGEYNFTQLVSGDYELRVWANDYREYIGSVTVVPGANTFLVEMLPRDIPNTCKLSGWVNDSDSGAPIAGAQVQVGIGWDDHGEDNFTVTDVGGYYEMWIAPYRLEWLANASNHEHANGSFDASGLTEMELNVELTPDLWSPNITRFDQAPLENVSTVNPSVSDIEFDEDDLSSMSLWHFKYWYNDGMWDYFYSVQALYVNFNPLSYQGAGMPYSVVGDHYTVHYEWDAQVSGGWLWNATDEVYLPAWEVWAGPDAYDGLRGYYMNESSPSWQTGTMFFDRSTGDPYMFRLDWDGMAADISDPTSMFAPEAQLIQKDPGSSFYNWWGSQQIGQWSVAGLSFDHDSVVPSDDYMMLFGVGDWGNHGWGDFRMLMVDNDPPVADAGSDMNADTNIPTLLDGAASSDNVGVSFYRWEYIDDLGETVILFGETASATFNASGTYEVTLTVWDAAGNQDNDTLTVTVSDGVPPVAEAGPDQNKMAGEFVYFDASGSSDNVGIVNWTWTFTSDGVDYTLYGENVSFIFNLDPEDVVVTLTVTDAENNTDVDTMTVHISGWIPEFPTLLIPVMVVAGVVLIVSRRKR